MDEATISDPLLIPVIGFKMTHPKLDNTKAVSKVTLGPFVCQNVINKGNFFENIALSKYFR